jgi:hypothetical protein
MYKNFTLTESERKEILEMHMSYGYKKPLKEEYIDVDNNIDEDDIITEISLEGVSSEGNPIIKMVMRSAIGETKQTAEFTNITVICEWKMLKSWRVWDRKKRLTDTYIINNVLDIKSDIQLPQKAIQFLNNIFKINSNYYSVIKEIYKPYVDFLYSKKDLDKEKYTNLISKIEGYISMNVDNFGKLLSDFKWKNYDKQVGI